MTVILIGFLMLPIVLLVDLVLVLMTTLKAKDGHV